MMNYYCHNATSGTPVCDNKWDSMNFFLFTRPLISTILNDCVLQTMNGLCVTNYEWLGSEHWRDACIG